MHVESLSLQIHPESGMVYSKVWILHIVCNVSDDYRLLFYVTSKPSSLIKVSAKLVLPGVGNKVTEEGKWQIQQIQSRYMTKQTDCPIYKSNAHPNSHALITFSIQKRWAGFGFYLSIYMPNHYTQVTCYTPLVDLYFASIVTCLWLLC